MATKVIKTERNAKGRHMRRIEPSLVPTLFREQDLEATHGSFGLVFEHDEEAEEVGYTTKGRLCLVAALAIAIDGERASVIIDDDDYVDGQSSQRVADLAKLVGLGLWYCRGLCDGWDGTDCIDGVQNDIHVPLGAPLEYDIGVKDGWDAWHACVAANIADA